jgi:hypothetical protein
MMERTAMSAAYAAHGADLFPGHLTQSLPVAPHGEEQDGHVLHGPGEYDADDDPDRPRQEPHLRGQHRTYQRPAPAIAAKWCPKSTLRSIGMSPGRCPDARPGSPWCHPLPELALDKAGVEAVRYGVGRQGRKEQPTGVYRLAAGEGQHTPANSAYERDDDPDGISA